MYTCIYTNAHTHTHTHTHTTFKRGYPPQTKRNYYTLTRIHMKKNTYTARILMKKNKCTHTHTHTHTLKSPAKSGYPSQTKRNCST
jgi:hypothetical protein